MSGIGDIRRIINSDHISDLIPISKINEETQDIYKEYILAATTYKDIIKEYPFLDGEPLYASKSISCPCYYYDKESLFPINLFPIVEKVNGTLITKPFLFDNADKYNERIVNIKNEFKNGEGFKYIDSDTMALEFFIENIEKIDRSKLFSQAMDLYTSKDYGFEFLDKDKFRYIMESRTKEDIKQLNQNITDLEDEVTVYRGEGDYSSSNGYSYSLDINTAVFFAARYTESKKACVIKGKIKKEDILWYSNGRNEKEIIVYPEKVYGKERIMQYTCFDEEINLCMESTLDIYQCYRAVLKKFPYDHKGYDHNKEHMLRVLFLGLLMVTRECPEIHLNDKDVHTLAISLSLHDIGRNNDTDDTEHGIESYNIFNKNFKKITKMGKEYYNDDWIKFLMEYHCKDDKLALGEIKNMNLNFAERIKLISFYNILKDADALDRVRFGIKCLDVNYLRLKNSIKYVLFANQLKGNLKL